MTNVMRTAWMAIIFLAAGGAFCDELIWSDEFDGTVLDLKKWDKPEYNRRNNSNGPDGWWLKEDSFLDGKGHLIVRARQIPNRNNDNDPYDYSTGAIRTIGKFEQRYGRFEIRCRLPKQPGWWVAFWLYSSSVLREDGSGEDGTEIDIFEGFGWTDAVQHALHWDGYGSSHQWVAKRYTMEGIREGFHTFALEWYENIYIFFIDGVESWRTNAGGVSKVPAYVKITGELSTESWAVGPGWANDPFKATYPDSFVIDWVRVYKLAETVSTRPDPNDHLAYRKSVSASSTLSSAYNARRGVDGNISTRWASQPGDPQWYRVDLGERCTVDKVVINWAKNFGKEYLIQLADQPDGPWTECLHVSDHQAAGLVFHEFAPQIGRYVRLYGIESAEHAGFSFYEFAVHGAPASAGVSRNSIFPSRVRLEPNYPNPFNSSTQIRYTLVEDAEVRLTLYTLSGRIIDVPVREKQAAGEHVFIWRADAFPSGIYFCRLETGGEDKVIKMLLNR